MSKKKRSRCENVEAPATAKRVNSERNDDRLLWRIVTDHPDIFDTHIVPKLNGNDLNSFTTSIGKSRGDKTFGRAFGCCLQDSIF